MFAIPLHPLVFAVLLALFVEIVLIPLYDLVAEKVNAFHNRFVLQHRHRGVLMFDCSILVPVNGIYLSRSHLTVASVLKKLIIFGFIVGELFLDAEPVKLKENVVGRVVKGLDGFRNWIDYPNTAEDFGLEFPFIRHACNEQGTVFETAYIGNETLCSEVEIFSFYYEPPTAGGEYDTERPCAIGNLTNERMTCDGNRVQFSRIADSPKVLRMFELLNETTLRYARLSTGENIFNDVVVVNFRKPVTSEAIEMIARHDSCGVPYIFTLVTASIYEDPNLGNSNEMRRAEVFRGQVLHTTVTKPALVVLGLILALFGFILLIVSAFLYAWAPVMGSGDANTNAICTSEDLASLAAGIMSTKKVKHHIFLKETGNGPHLELYAEPAGYQRFIVSWVTNLLSCLTSRHRNGEVEGTGNDNLQLPTSVLPPPMLPKQPSRGSLSRSLSF